MSTATIPCHFEVERRARRGQFWEPAGSVRAVSGLAGAQQLGALPGDAITVMIQGASFFYWAVAGDDGVQLQALAQ